MGMATCGAKGGCVRHHHLLMSRHWSLPRPHVTAQQTLNAQLWADSQYPAAVTTLSDAASTTTPNGILADGSHCQSNSSSLSNILDRLETLSVASVGYETCVWKEKRNLNFSFRAQTQTAHFFNVNLAIVLARRFINRHKTIRKINSTWCGRKDANEITQRESKIGNKGGTTIVHDIDYYYYCVVYLCICTLSSGQRALYYCEYRTALAKEVEKYWISKFIIFLPFKNCC